MRRPVQRQRDRGDDGKGVRHGGRAAGGRDHRSRAERHGADQADPGQDPLTSHPVGHRREQRCEERRRSHARPGDDADRSTPPSRNARTAIPTMKALSLAHIAPNETLRAPDRPARGDVVERARPDAHPRETSRHGANYPMLTRASRDRVGRVVPRSTGRFDSRCNASSPRRKRWAGHGSACSRRPRFDLRACGRAAARHRALRAAAPRARHDQRVHQGLDGRATRRRIPRRRGRGHHVGPDRPDRAPPGRERPDVDARDAHLRRVLEAARPGQPLSGRADPRQRALLPQVGVRERCPGPRPAPERPLAAGGDRPSRPAGQVRGVDPDRRPAERPPAPAAAGRGPRAPLQAGPDARLGR